MVAVPAVVALAVLFFARGPVPWSGSLRCSWPCCRPSSAWSCCWSPPVRIAAGLPVVVVAGAVLVVVGKEQGGRVIRGPGGVQPGAGPAVRQVVPGSCSAWCRAWCRIAGGVAGVRLVPAG